jgi:hypothetical protein
MNPVIKLHMLAVIPHLMRNPEDLLCISFWIPASAGINMSHWLTKVHENTINSPFGKGGIKGDFKNKWLQL